MERRFQYYSVHAFHEAYAVYTGPGPGSILLNNTMQKLTLNYTRLHEHTHLIHEH